MKGTIIQITGLPRFGSAFMSVIFSLRPDSIGLHEEATLDPDWMKTIDGLRRQYAWVADCCTYGCFGKATQPEGPKVYVFHDPTESATECQERFGYHVDPEMFKEVLKIGHAWAIEQRALMVNRNDLFTLDSQRAIWKHCYGEDDSFPLEKVKRLLTLNIQRHKPETVFTIENGQRLATTLFDVWA
jgi:hypothetical protein